jgi:hypothetical protein
VSIYNNKNEYKMYNERRNLALFIDKAFERRCIPSKPMTLSRRFKVVSA